MERDVSSIASIVARSCAGVPDSHVTEDTAWGFNGARREVPWHGPWRGKGGLPGFFQSMAANIDVTAFEPMTFKAVGDDVFVHVHIAHGVKKTGKTVDEEQVHWWTCNADGKVSRMQH
jgi:ketosteroid isomerase-like protein